MGRSAILGEQRNNYFCDVACGRGEMVSTETLRQTPGSVLSVRLVKLTMNKALKLTTSED